jgi:hypothetical protein
MRIQATDLQFKTEISNNALLRTQIIRFHLSNCYLELSSRTGLPGSPCKPGKPVSPFDPCKTQMRNCHRITNSTASGNGRSSECSMRRVTIASQHLVK